MNSLKTILFFVIGIFAISSVSASIYSSGLWSNSQQSMTVTNGQNADFNAYVSTIPWNSMTVTIKLYDSGYNLLNTFENAKSVSSSMFYNSYTVTHSMYQNTGTYYAVIMGTDVDGSDSYTLTLTVNPAPAPPNNPPTISPIPNQNVNENSAYSYSVSASDTDADSLTYSLSGAPSGISINSAGLISGTSPDVSSDTNYNIAVSVSDGHNSPVSTSYTLTVKNVPAPDTTAPVIAILGNNPETVQVGSAYTDAGATATDNLDGDITSRISTTNNVNPNVIGTYTVVYTVSDNAGNLASATRTVNVVDTTNPTITLTGANPQTINVGSPYTELGATASDNYDGDITGSVTIDSSSVNTNVLGSYTVSYSVSDSSGNSASASRTVNVVDNVKPVITLNGANPMTIEVGSAYTEPGATATDNYDGDITDSIATSGFINTAVLGTYTTTYSVSDSSGNTASATRTVNVVDTTAPVITLNGANPQSIFVGSPYVELGATASDNYDGSLTSSIVIDSSSVNTGVLGSYAVVYNVSDLSGNKASFSRTVNVIPLPDTTPPAISINLPINKYYNVNPVLFNITATDSRGISACWFSIDSGSNTTMSVLGTDYHSSSSVSEGTHSVDFYCNDTSGNIASASRNFSSDVTSPSVSFQSPTSQGNLSQNFILVNLNSSDLLSGVKQINVTLYNASGIAGNYSSTFSNFSFMFSNLSDGNYFLNATAVDNAGNKNSTITIPITLDTHAPSVSISGPLNKTYTSKVTELDYSASDTNLKACWYSINGGTTKVSTSCSSKITGLSSGEGSNTWLIYATDFAGNNASASITFSVNTSSGSSGGGSGGSGGSSGSSYSYSNTYTPTPQQVIPINETSEKISLGAQNNQEQKPNLTWILMVGILGVILFIVVFILLKQESKKR